jgi:hypothetical protein
MSAVQRLLEGASAIVCVVSGRLPSGLAAELEWIEQQRRVDDTLVYYTDDLNWLPSLGHKRPAPPLLARARSSFPHVRVDPTLAIDFDASRSSTRNETLALLIAHFDVILQRLRSSAEAPRVGPT